MIVFDPEMDSVLVEGEVIFQGTPDELKAYLISDETRRGCKVWSSVQQAYMSGHEYLLL